MSELLSLLPEYGTAHLQLTLAALVLGGLVGAFRKLARGAPAEPARNWLPAALGLGLAFGGAALLLAARGLGVGAELALVPDLLGKPGVGSRRDAAAWQPEQLLWWMTAGAPVAFVLRKLSFGWLSPATTAGVAIVVAAGAGLLVWAFVQTRDGREPTGPPAITRVDSSLVVALNQPAGG